MVRLQHYEGSAQPRAEVAILWLDGNSKITFKALDGDSSEVLRQQPSAPRFIQILPGPHTVLVSFTTVLDHQPGRDLVATSKTDKLLEFEAEAGKFYTVASHMDLDVMSENHSHEGTVRLPWSATIEATMDPDPPIQY